MTDLRLCQLLRMSYADVRALPWAVYVVALEDLQAADARTREATEA